MVYRYTDEGGAYWVEAWMMYGDNGVRVAFSRSVTRKINKYCKNIV